MNIRRAETGDIPRLGDLLLQVCRVHHRGRPDLFRAGGRKYTDEELAALLTDPSRPILVAEDEAGAVQGYAFCVVQPHRGETAMEACIWTTCAWTRPAGGSMWAAPSTGRCWNLHGPLGAIT